MFRIFLKSKLLDGDDAPSRKQPSAKSGTTTKPQKGRNRRIFERYAVDHKHLVLMNEQDILVVRDISAKGFSTQVSPRGRERLSIGDIYAARIRYLGEIYDLDARVSWKSGELVGFEIVKASRATLVFLKRLLRPIEIAASLREVNATFMSENQEDKRWYHGDEGTDLYLWRDETGSLAAWQLVTSQIYLEWKRGEHLSSGTVTFVNMPKNFASESFSGITARDPELDPVKRTFATDVIMALTIPEREEVIATLGESLSQAS